MASLAFVSVVDGLEEGLGGLREKRGVCLCASVYAHKRPKKKNINLKISVHFM